MVQIGRLRTNNWLPALILIGCLSVLNGCFRVAPDLFAGCVNAENDEVLSMLSPHIANALGKNSRGVDGEDALSVVTRNSNFGIMDCPDRFEVYTYSKGDKVFLGRDWNYVFQKPDLKLVAVWGVVFQEKYDEELVFVQKAIGYEPPV